MVIPYRAVGHYDPDPRRGRIEPCPTCGGRHDMQHHACTFWIPGGSRLRRLAVLRCEDLGRVALLEVLP